MPNLEPMSHSRICHALKLRSCSQLHDFHTKSGHGGENEFSTTPPLCWDYIPSMMTTLILSANDEISFFSNLPKITKGYNIEKATTQMTYYKISAKYYKTEVKINKEIEITCTSSDLWKNTDELKISVTVQKGPSKDV